MSSDGPKNSQGYIRNLAAAGMTGEPEFEQLLSYTCNEWTREVANAWIRYASDAFAQAFENFPRAQIIRRRVECTAICEYMTSIADARDCPTELRSAIIRYVRWRAKNLK